LNQQLACYLPAAYLAITLLPLLTIFVLPPVLIPLEKPDGNRNPTTARQIPGNDITRIMDTQVYSANTNREDHHHAKKNQENPCPPSRNVTP